MCHPVCYALVHDTLGKRPASSRTTSVLHHSALPLPETVHSLGKMFFVYSPQVCPIKTHMPQMKRKTKPRAWNIHRYGSLYSMRVILTPRLLVPLQRARGPGTEFFSKEEDLLQSKWSAPVYLKLIYLTITHFIKARWSYIKLTD